MLIFLSLFYWTDVKTFFSVCPDRHFISNRKCVPCQGHCKGGAPCNKLTGRCDNGCQNYWTGDLCQSVYHSFKSNTWFCMLVISFKVLCMFFFLLFCSFFCSCCCFLFGFFFEGGGGAKQCLCPIFLWIFSFKYTKYENKFDFKYMEL